MNIQILECKNCAYFRPSSGFVPNECVMGNNPTPVADGVCDEQQEHHEVTADHAQAIVRGSVPPDWSCQ